MSNNPQTPKIIFFDRKDKTARAGKEYLVIYDKAGQQHLISEKRRSLWSLFDNAFDYQAFLLVHETYNKVEYIADVKSIADELLQRSIQEIGKKITDQAAEERNRSQSIAYAKDLKCAGVLSGDMYEEAGRIYQFIKKGKVQDGD